ncbi:hypothetical protein K6U44_03780 [Vibrio parahaemolyticus]|uniref:hypothetical protein n=1 Tax=Vibrio parahaemolyticus TaxID=670 RepID=UPI001EEB5422|nr:hypothetical protein [Vibrio parahaemolyticus]MCG6459581.1 hypothetical protein [Vibrio parahaemolyticus]
MKKLIITIALFVVSTSAHAWISKGALGCGVYVEDFEKGGWEKIANGGWLAGALTGYNYANNTRVGDGVDIKSIQLHVYNYCKDNPLKDTAHAMQNLIDNLK